MVTASLLLVAATPAEVVPELEANGYYIEDGSGATEAVVSEAVSDARSEGGRLYVVVLASEPPGGATTFSDSVLDRLGSGYVVTVAPETVGFAGDGSFWSAEQMNAAVDASLNGGSDDEVVRLFVDALSRGVSAPGEAGDPAASGGGLPWWVWLLVIGGGAMLFITMSSRGSRQRRERASAELDKIKTAARAKLADLADDIIEMEDEIALAEHAEAVAHYQRASATYTDVLARLERDPGATEMLELIGDLDLAIWELDAAEAILDGKPIPPKPELAEAPPPTRADPVPTGARVPPEEAGRHPQRRPQRRSSYVGNDLMSALWAILAMGGRGGRWGGGLPGGFGGPMRGGSGRMRGGGLRGLGGRMRGGGRRG